MENVIDDGLTVPRRIQLGYTHLDNSLVIALHMDLNKIEDIIVTLSLRLVVFCNYDLKV